MRIWLDLQNIVLASGQEHDIYRMREEIRRELLRRLGARPGLQLRETPPSASAAIAEHIALAVSKGVDQ